MDSNSPKYPSDQHIHTIAEVCHNAVRAWMHLHGDPTYPTWLLSPGYMKRANISSVEFILTNPDSTFQEIHGNWCSSKVKEGWKYGKVLNSHRKTHPCLIPYDELPPKQKGKNAIYKGIVLHLRGIVDS